MQSIQAENKTLHEKLNNEKRREGIHSKLPDDSFGRRSSPTTMKKRVRSASQKEQFYDSAREDPDENDDDDEGEVSHGPIKSVRSKAEQKEREENKINKKVKFPSSPALTPTDDYCRTSHIAISHPHPLRRKGRQIRQK